MSPRDAAAAEVGGVRLTNPDRVLYPQQGITKRELAAYLKAVAPRMLAHLEGRLLSLVRCPQGRAKHCFFQKHGGATFPEAFHRFPVRERSGPVQDYMYLDDAEGLVTAAQFGVLEFHLWGSRIADIEKPDRVVFDLDPDPTVDFEAVKAAARRMREVLAALGLESFPMLTGGKGIHVVAPIRPRHPWPVVKAFTRAVSERVVADAPDRFVATMTKAKRKGRIFIDHFRNERGSTAICPYSPRAREGAPVAWPVSWAALGRYGSADCVDIRAARRRLGADPWKDYAGLRQELRDAALRAVGTVT